MDGRHSGSPEQPRPPDRREWHSLVEQYTPDGALGRLLLGSVTGSVAAFASLLALTTNPFSLLAILFVLVTGGIALLTWLPTVLVLWPVYLSLIGNLESAADYPVGKESAPESSSAAGTTAATEPTAPPGSPESGEDAVAILKRRYAAGELSEEEFDRRLDDLLETEELLRTKAEPTGVRNGDAVPEPERG